MIFIFIGYPMSRDNSGRNLHIIGYLVLVFINIIAHRSNHTGAKFILYGYYVQNLFL